MKIYSEESRIKTYHVDNTGCLSIHQIFNFLQEAAYRHSVVGKFGQPNLAKLNLVWMVSRMKVEILDKVVLGDTVEVKTWVRSIIGALSERDFTIVCNNKEVVRATSLWACLSTETFKPTHIPTKIIARMSINEKGKLNLLTTKVLPGKEWKGTHKYRVCPSDVDMVNHTNNVAYVRAVFDTLGKKDKPICLDVNFLKQSFLNDVLVIKNSTLEKTGLHEVTNNKEEVVFRMKTRWENL